MNKQPSIAPNHTQQPIQVTVVGGYLGAGKTTLINHMLSQQDMSGCVFLINDFGSFNIDANLIAARGGDTIELKNGCICCSIAGGLVTTLLKLVRRTPRPNRIVIEASGVSDPAKIADIARMSPSLSLNKVIIVADAKRVRQTVEDPLIGDMLLKQLAAADLLLLNKVDNLNQVERQLLCDWLHELSPKASLHQTRYAQLPAAILFDDNNTPLFTSFTAPTPPIEQPSDQPMAHKVGFKAWSYESSKPFKRVEFGQLLDSLPNTIQRMKGFVSFDEASESTYLLQMTPGSWTLTEETPVVPLSAKTQLNVIGNEDFSIAELATRFNGVQSERSQGDSRPS